MCKNLHTARWEKRHTREVSLAVSLPGPQRFRMGRWSTQFSTILFTSGRQRLHVERGFREPHAVPTVPLADHVYSRKCIPHAKSVHMC